MESNCPISCFGHRRDISDQKDQVGTSKSHHIICGLYKSLVMLHRSSPEISEFLNIIEIFSTLKLPTQITNKKCSKLSLNYSSPIFPPYKKGISKEFIFKLHNVVCTLYEISYHSYYAWRNATTY